jgi:hypothetical protein
VDGLVLPALGRAGTPPRSDPDADPDAGPAGGAAALPGAGHDLLSGLVGQAAYLSLRSPSARTDPALAAVLAALRGLLPAGQLPLPTPAAAVPDWQRGIAPHGYVDLGLAHGVAGPLAVLALLGDRGCPETLRRLAGWLAGAAVSGPVGPGWPRVLLLTAAGGTEPGPPNRPGWCYGTPGVARALWLAGRTLGDASVQDLAATAMLAALADIDELAAPTLCHGLAGLLLITALFAADTGEPAFVAATAELTDRLLASYDPATLLGYQDVEVLGARVDNPGLLAGAAGIVLALLAVDAPTPPAWARLLLLG